ncbi:hypothetical protein, partial [Alistipes putredinis]|uniref:hypothetical protein n=1 Tax=Alistipes putredinis TaxID=28117 RepID=UPI0032BF8552
KIVADHCLYKEKETDLKKSLLGRPLFNGVSEPADRKRTLPSTFIIPSPASPPESAQIQRRISNNDRIHAVTVPFPQTLQIMFVGHISR